MIRGGSRNHTRFCEVSCEILPAVIHDIGNRQINREIKMSPVRHASHALVAIIMALSAYCMSALSANSLPIGPIGGVNAVQDVEKKTCNKLTAPEQKKQKCHRITLSSVSASGRNRSDETGAILWRRQATAAILTWFAAVDSPRVIVTANSRGDPGSRAPFWHVFAAAPRLRN